MTRLRFPCFLALVKFHKNEPKKFLTNNREIVFLNSMSLDGNNFFVISQSLVTQFIFLSISNHRSCLQSVVYMEQILKEKNLRNLLTLIFQLLDFECCVECVGEPRNVVME